METLDLSGDWLFGMRPLMVSNLKMLRKFVLNDNKFSSSLPTTTGILGELIGLSVHVDSLSGNLPSELGNLQNI